MSKQWGSLTIENNIGLVGAGKLKAAEAPKPAQLNKCIGDNCTALVKKNKIRCSPCQYDHLEANRKKYAPIIRKNQKEKKEKHLTK